jgi:hypothetical protein
MLPTHTMHNLFAHHEDTAHDYCATHHGHLGLHVEKKHTHCEILKTNTPVYDSPDLFVFEKTEAIIIAEVKSNYSSVHFNSLVFNIPARGPPTV